MTSLSYIYPNASFTGTVNKPTQLPVLNVSKLSVSKATISFTTDNATVEENLTINNGFISVKQTTLPVVTTTFGAGTPSLKAGSTDVAGQVTVTGGTPAAGNTITVTYHTVYTTVPLSQPTVVFTAANESAAAAITTGLYCISSSTGFKFTFVAASGISPKFNYMTIGLE